MDIELKIDPEFEKVCPPLTDDEFKQLEANILSEGEVFTPIFTWNGFIVDGHHRNRIIQKHPEIKYRALERSFDNRYEAISWICNNQLGRRNLSIIQRTALIGRRYDAEKKSRGASDGFRGNQYAKVVNRHNDGLPDCGDETAQKIADEMGVSKRTVERAGAFTRGLDAAEEVLPGIEMDIIAGQITPPINEVSAIAKAPPEERRQMAEDLRLSPDERKSRKEQREVMRSIEAISAELARPKEKNDVDNVLGIIEGAAETFKKTCVFYIDEFPELLDTDKPRLIKVIDDLKQYICYLYEGEPQ